MEEILTNPVVLTRALEPVSSKGTPFASTERSTRNVGSGPPRLRRLRFDFHDTLFTSDTVETLTLFRGTPVKPLLEPRSPKGVGTSVFSCPVSVFVGSPSRLWLQ